MEDINEGESFVQPEVIMVDANIAEYAETTFSPAAKSAEASTSTTVRISTAANTSYSAAIGGDTATRARKRKFQNEAPQFEKFFNTDEKKA